MKHVFGTALTASMLFSFMHGDDAAAAPRVQTKPWNPPLRAQAKATIDPAPIRRGALASKFATPAAGATATRAVHNDIDGDLRSDLFWMTTSHLSQSGHTAFSLAYWRMDGTSVSSTFSYKASTEYFSETTGDFDGDGRADILWFNYRFDRPNTPVYMWRSRGDGSFDTPYVASVPNNWSSSQIPSSVDINGDGRDDILWKNYGANQGAYWLMNGTTVIGSSVFELGSDYVFSGAGDFDGDGRDDILCSHSTLGHLYLWRNRGDGGFDASLIATYDPAWTIAGNPDLNGDGRADIVWLNARQNMIAYWWMDGVSVIRTGTRWAGYSPWLTTGDFDGDGLGDIVWMQRESPYYTFLLRSRSEGGFDEQLIGPVASNWVPMR